MDTDRAYANLVVTITEAIMSEEGFKDIESMGPALMACREDVVRVFDNNGYPASQHDALVDDLAHLMLNRIEFASVASKVLQVVTDLQEETGGNG